jgi:hypothetical protein
MAVAFTCSGPRWECNVSKFVDPDFLSSGLGLGVIADRADVELELAALAHFVVPNVPMGSVVQSQYEPANVPMRRACGLASGEKLA